MSSSVRMRWLVMSSSKALKEEVKRLYGDKVRRSPSVRPLSRDQAIFKGSGHFQGIRPLVLLSSEAFIEALSAWRSMVLLAVVLRVWRKYHRRNKATGAGI